MEYADTTPMSTAEIPQLVSLEAARQALGGISRQTLWRLVRAGQLESVTIGRRRFVPAESIQALIESSTSRASSVSQEVAP